MFIKSYIKWIYYGMFQKIEIWILIFQKQESIMAWKVILLDIDSYLSYFDIINTNLELRTEISDCNYNFKNSAKSS